jgi:UPF0755 protein
MPKKNNNKTDHKKKKIGRKSAAKTNTTRFVFVRKYKTFLFVLFLAMLSTVSFYLFVRPVTDDAREYSVVPGATVSSVAKDLGQNNLFKIVVLLNGNEVMAGTYDLPAGASVWRVGKMFARGEISSISVTIPEGLTVKQVSNLLNKEQYLVGDIKPIYKDGDLFPSTYLIAKGTSRQVVMDLMATKMDSVRDGWEKSGVGARYPLQNWNDIIILASIVQKETSKIEEMPVVASVYLNRLRKKMRLQADPTVVYAITDGLGDMRQKKLYSKNLQIPSPYNTYKNLGLPPTPIANVGMDAILAVLKPADTNYYFFVADGKGGHTFSRTLEEHNKNRSLWKIIKNAKK